MHEITIDNWHPVSVNKLINSHWAIASKLKKRDKVEIRYASNHIPPAKGKRRVELIIELGKGQRALDPDNYAKSLGDALVASGLLVNDSHKWVEWSPVQFVRGKKKTTVRLYDCTD
jgi:Holliday junction resolvase RusA-like endonuclease